jgi:hypothetical protein
MSVRKLLKSAVLWALVALMVSSCWCDTQFPAVVGQAIATTTAQALEQQSSATSSAPQPKVICPMEWVTPPAEFNGGKMPPTGKTTFDWMDHPTASDYSLVVTMPNGSPVNYDVNGSSKDLFMENLNQVGSYVVEVTALGSDGASLCSITMNFNKAVIINNSSDNNSSGDDDSSPSSVIPSNPVVMPSPMPTPTEVEIN